MYARHAIGVFAVAALCVGRPASAHTLTSTLSGLVAPKLLRDAAPDYPPAALADGVAGTLHALLELSVTGTVTAVHLQNSLREDLDLAAIAAARRLMFRPAFSDGKAIPASIRFHFHFRAPAPSAPPLAEAAPPAPSPLEPAPSPLEPAPALGAESATVASGVIQTVNVRGKNARRSASEIVRERDVLEAAPHRSADELLFTVPGVFITQHGGEGKAFQIFYRGFDAVHGQDLEIWAAGAPVNDVSNVHGQGYADLHFLPTEVVKELRATPGTFDPHQGDFAIAGTLRFDVGLADPGLTAKAELGSFGSRRFFLGFRPAQASDQTFGAVELYHTDGFGPSRSAERASAVGQWVQALGAEDQLRIFASLFTGQFASAGVLKLADVEAGRVDRFATYDPNQGGASSRAQLVAALEHQDDGARWSLSTYLVLRSMRLRENFTGYLKDPSGDSEQQQNRALVLGATGSYRRKLSIFSKKDAIEGGFFARADWIDQSQRRLSVVDGSVTADEVDARVLGFDVAGFVDLCLSPWERLTVRGGVRLDGLGYSAEDVGGAAAGQARSSQGTHFGAKGTVDLKILPELHALLSYGDGFRSPQARSLSEGETTPFTTVRSGELGLQLSLPFLRGSLAGFYTTLSDDLVFDQSTARNERVPSTRRLGMSAEVEAVELGGLVLAASLTFTQAEFSASSAQYHAGDLVPYAPQIVGRIDAGYRLSLGELWELPVEAQVGGALSVLARRPLPFGQMGHDVALIDARAELSVGPASLGLECMNVLDSGWFDGEFVYASKWNPNDAAALVPGRVVTAGAPRTFMGTLTVRI